MAVCMGLLVMQLLEKLYMAGIVVLAKLFNWETEKFYKHEPLVQDEEMGNLDFPVVLVQIPMYNEREARSSYFLLSIIRYSLSVLT